MDEIYLGGGCFWCIESVFNEIIGVESAISGYMGGMNANPTYKEVCSGMTGHNEVVKVTYDSSLISLDQLLTIFWTVHDPTTLNRQGNDRGTQYRSGIYYLKHEDLDIINHSIDSIAKELWSDPIVTEVMEAPVFYPAEDYHQEYYKNNSSQGYCSFVIAPKLSKVRSSFSHLLKKKAS